IILLERHVLRADAADQGNVGTQLPKQVVRDLRILLGCPGEADDQGVVARRRHLHHVRQPERPLDRRKVAAPEPVCTGVLAGSLREVLRRLRPRRVAWKILVVERRRKGRAYGTAALSAETDEERKFIFLIDAEEGVKP